MDVCAFVGVSPRGPSRVPVVDESWPEGPSSLDPARPRWHSVAVAVESPAAYRDLFGGFEGPGRLPYAVNAFFAQGGRRAYVVRVVHAYGDARDGAGVGRAEMPGIVDDAAMPVVFEAIDEGSWGNGLRVTLGWSVTDVIGVGDFAPAAGTFTLPPDRGLPVGSALRLRLADETLLWRTVADARRPNRGGADDRYVLTLDAPAPGATSRVELVTAELAVDDGDGRREAWTGLGISPAHPRGIAAVLCAESRLLRPAWRWAQRGLVPLDLRLPSLACAPFGEGEDRYADITPDDFFDPLWVAGTDGIGRGVHALVELDDLALVCVPDLYSPGPLVPPDAVVEVGPLAGATFEPCASVPPPVVAEGPPPPTLAGLQLDPALDLAAIIGWQSRLVELADTLRHFVALIDVPPGLKHREVLAWRQHFRSAFAAAYYAWPVVSVPADGREGLIRLNPSAVAAGMIAGREQRLGIVWGPANERVIGGVALDERPADDLLGELHRAQVNAFVMAPDGVRLVAARTLSTERDWRQLSVRRLMSQLERTLRQRMQWVVFEPGNPSTRAQVARLVRGYLLRLFRAGSLAGATPDEAFFVRADERQNPRAIVDAGQLVVEVGVAVAEPLEYLVVRLLGDETGLQVES